jgi:hypothetical protein
MADELIPAPITRSFCGLFPLFPLFIYGIFPRGASLDP